MVPPRTLHVHADYQEIFGEPGVKRGAKGVQNEEMAVAVDCLMNARESTSTLNRVVETIVDTIGRFNERMQRDT